MCGMGWFRRQIEKNFQNSYVSMGDHTKSIERELRSGVKEDITDNTDACLCYVIVTRCLSWCYYEDLPQIKAGARIVLYMRLNVTLTNLCAELLRKPFLKKENELLQ